MYKLKSSDRTKLENHIYFYLRGKLDLLEDAELEALSPEALLEGEVFSPDPGAAWWVDDPAEGRALFLHMAGQALQDEREAREQGTLELD